MEYFAFGETFIEEHKNSHNSPYKFNGKELDEESGYSYFGARYLDMRYSMWISVDPFMYDGTFWDGEGNSVGVFDPKTLSIYSFSFNNPLNVTDPDGRDIVIRGKNNSKIVVKTSLISFEANMSSGVLAMDFGGQHVLKGNDALHFALDVVGILDPTGAADSINGALYLKEGNYWDAAISGVGLAMYVGDVAKLGRLWKGYDKIKDMLKLKPCGCFISGTQVLTKEGYKNIEEIQKGDIVWAFDDKTGDLQPKKVTETYTLEFSQIFKLYIGDEIVEVTHEHPFFIGGKWLQADELKVGDFVTLYDGTTKRIDKIDFIAKGNFKVYTFEVEDYHSYFVGQSKILVHNGNPCNLLSKALVKFSTKEFRVGKHVFKLDKAGMKHILERHHPKYWDGSIKETQSFLPSNWTTENVADAANSVISQNIEKIRNMKSNKGMFQIQGTYDGKTVIVGFKDGKIGQLYTK